MEKFILIKRIIEIADLDVKAYRSDILLDVKAIIKHQNDFIYCTRDSGTHLIIISESGSSGYNHDKWLIDFAEGILRMNTKYYGYFFGELKEMSRQEANGLILLRGVEKCYA